MIPLEYPSLHFTSIDVVVVMLSRAFDDSSTYFNPQYTNSLDCVVMLSRAFDDSSENDVAAQVHPKTRVVMLSRAFDDSSPGITADLLPPPSACFYSNQAKTPHPIHYNASFRSACPTCFNAAHPPPLFSFSMLFALPDALAFI